MVTVQIRWEGREETISERFGVIKNFLDGLPCLGISPAGPYYANYICKDVIISVNNDIDNVYVEIAGVSSDVFSYAIVIASKIKRYIRDKVDKKEWGEDNPEASFHASFYEVEVRCR
jgi:hypothetical protein